MDSGDGGESPKARRAPLGIDGGGNGGGGGASCSATAASPQLESEGAARAGAPRASEGDGGAKSGGNATHERSLFEEVGATLAWPSLIAAVIALAVTIAAQPQSHRWPLTPENQAAMFSYPEVHSAVPGWLLTVISIALVAYAAAAELAWQWWHKVLPKRARVLMACALVLDACEAVAWAIFMTMWLKRYTGVPRPNFAATCRSVSVSDGNRVICSTGHGPTGPDSSRQGFPSGHASIMSALAVFTSAHLASRFAGARPRPQQPSQQRGVAVSARRDWLLRASRATVASALVMPAVIAPVVVALWVSASRIRDFAHSAGDVSGGLLLGGAFGALLLARTRALDAQLRAEAASTS